MQKHISVIQLTANFEANLEAIENFWVARGQPQQYGQLLNTLSDTVIPNLECFPEIGRPFLAYQPASVEALNRTDKLNKQLAQLDTITGIREYILDDYLLLYATAANTIYLLSIRHHKQLSFDFEHFWAQQP